MCCDDSRQTNRSGVFPVTLFKKKKKERRERKKNSSTIKFSFFSISISRRSERKGDGRRGSIDSSSCFIFSLRTGGNSHCDPPPHTTPYPPAILMATVHSGQTIQAQSSRSDPSSYTSSSPCTTTFPTSLPFVLFLLRPPRPSLRQAE